MIPFTKRNQELMKTPDADAEIASTPAFAWGWGVLRASLWKTQSKQQSAEPHPSLHDLVLEVFKRANTFGSV